MRTEAAIAHPDSVDASPVDDASLAMDNLRRVVRALRSANVDAERDHGITAAKLFVLRQIASAPGQCLADVARRTLTAQSSVSEVVAKLVAADLVTRAVSSSDRRRVTLTLTDAGRRIVEGAPETLQERLVEGFHSLSPEMGASLARSLAAWLALSGLGEVPATMFGE
jgi:DNA-binding MarR family transcriptional regulator